MSENEKIYDEILKHVDKIHDNMFSIYKIVNNSSDEHYFCVKIAEHLGAIRHYIDVIKGEDENAMS